jgi:hypothetical protein
MVCNVSSVARNEEKIQDKMFINYVDWMINFSFRGHKSTVSKRILLKIQGTLYYSLLS